MVGKEVNSAKQCERHVPVSGVHDLDTECATHPRLVSMPFWLRLASNACKLGICRRHLLSYLNKILN